MKKRILASILAASMLLSLAACGGGAKATTMHLMKTEGTVGVSDDGGKEIKPKENLGLYSGYGVDTQNDSYAWIDLDEVKLTKMDQNSDISIQKEDKHLEIVVNSGSLFFNVTEPLAEDETMEIRTSSMVVGIRGTCGWVEVPMDNCMNVYLLEGTVECSITDSDGRITSASVSGGESASLTFTPEGEGSIVLGSFQEGGVPAFVLAEITGDEALSGRIESDSGLELLGWDGDAAFAAALGGISYYGDPAACALTAEQRSLYAQILREEIAKSEAAVAGGNFGWETVVGTQCLAGMVDLGAGMPALMYGSGAEIATEYGNYLMWPGSEDCTVWAMWQFVDGQPVKLDSLDRTAVYTDHLYTGGNYVADPGIEASVYPFENGQIASAPSTTAMDRSEWYWDGDRPEERVIDGQLATPEQIDAWEARWNPGSPLAGFSHGSDVAIDFWGLSPAQDVLAVLEGGSPGQADAPAQTRTVTAYDPNTHIRRTTIDPAGAPFEMYYEIPVFEEEGEGYAKINAFFQDLQDQFFSGNAVAEMREMALEGNPYGGIFFNTWSARITEQTDQYISVTMGYDWYAGGVVDYGMDCYVFDPSDGRRLILSDLVSGSESEIKEMIISALIQEYPDFAPEVTVGGEFSPDSTIRSHAMEDFDFYLVSGQIHVFFDKYEISYGAAGSFDVPLPVTVS